MTSLFNDNENIACESCGKVIMREMSFFDGELGNSDKDNGMTIIQKNTDDEYHYYSICGQHIYRKYRKRDKMVSYPQGQVVLGCSNSEFHRTFQFPERGWLYNSRSRTSKAF